MNSISKELMELNNYFEAVVNMIPDSITKGPVEKRKRPPDNKQSKIQSQAKKAKFNPPHLKAMRKFQQSVMEEEEEENDNAIPHRKHLSERKTNCSIEELHERLQKKIEELKKNREPKNRERKRKRGLVSERTKKKRTISDSIENTEVVSEMPKNQEKVNNSDALLTKEGKVVFSKFDFSQMIEKAPKQKASKKYKLPTGKNYELLLLKASKEKERIEKLKQTDPKKASQEVDKMTWTKVVAKAEGAKLKDDTELLKKSLKHKLAKKKRSAKEWEARNEKVREDMQRRQEKRNRNLKKRKDHKKKKGDMKRAKSTPGF